MNAYESIAEAIINISNQITALNSLKADFSKSITYQIIPFFQLLASSPCQADSPSIQISSLRRPLNLKQLNILINTRNRSQLVITPEDICDYLHISRHNLKRTSNLQKSLEETTVDEFYSILQREEDIENEFIDSLKQTDLENWFSQVDFFSNGYIDTSALSEFLIHYGSRTVQEYSILMVIRLIKKHSNSDKIFLQDVRQYVEPQKMNEQNPSISNNLRWHRATASANDQQNRIEQGRSRHKKYSQQILLSLQSQLSLISPSNFVSNLLLESSEHHINHEVQNTDKIRDISQLPSQHELLEDQQNQMTYEEKLIKVHKRNSKYINKLKKQMTTVVPICTLQVQSHLKSMALKATQKELLSRVCLLGQVYNKKCKDIASFILNHPKFNFLNAFQYIDINENNKITFEDWRLFIKNEKFQTTKNRVQLFFEIYSKNNFMRYSEFIRIFKHSGCQSQYQICEKRQPLFYEQWNDEFIEKFKIFLIRLLKYTEEEQVMREELTKRRKQLESIFQRHTYSEQFMELLGNNYDNFVRDHFKDGTLDIFMIYHIS